MNFFVGKNKYHKKWSDLFNNFERQIIDFEYEGVYSIKEVQIIKGILKYKIIIRIIIVMFHLGKWKKKNILKWFFTFNFCNDLHPIV